LTFIKKPFIDLIKTTMKSKKWHCLFFMIGLFFICSIGCKKNDDVKVPDISTDSIYNISYTTAICNGTIVSDGGSTLTESGVCWSTNQNPTVSDSKTNEGKGTGKFISNISGLTAGANYYIRAYATNKNGTGYGSSIPFTTLKVKEIEFNSSISYGSVSDIESNVYKTVTIGTQTWMAENLKSTKYNDGTAIPLVTDNATWAGSNSPAYCWYDNDAPTYKAAYGALYNWFVISRASNGNKNVCPVGWHLPGDDEWIILTDFLGGLNTAGGKMKEAGTAHWKSPNTGATNESGFTAIPAGLRYFDNGKFDRLGMSTDIRGSSKIINSGYWKRGLYYQTTNVFYDDGYTNQQYGLSIRCLKN
jgi:uncharacterized protein (TIGR02145 family)